MVSSPLVFWNFTIMFLVWVFFFPICCAGYLMKMDTLKLKYVSSCSGICLLMCLLISGIYLFIYLFMIYAVDDFYPLFLGSLWTFFCLDIEFLGLHTWNFLMCLFQFSNALSFALFSGRFPENLFPTLSLSLSFPLPYFPLLRDFFFSDGSVLKNIVFVSWVKCLISLRIVMNWFWRFYFPVSFYLLEIILSCLVLVID